MDWAELGRIAHALVAEQAGRVVGVAGLTVTEWNRRGTVAHRYVDRSWRGKAMGSQMMAHWSGGLDMSLYDPAVVLSQTAIYLSKEIVPPRAVSASNGAVAP